MQATYNLKAMEDLHRLFSRINECKWTIKTGEEAQAEYIRILGKLANITPDDSERGEKLTKKAIEQLRMVVNGEAAQKELEGYRRELEAKLTFGVHGDKPKLVRQGKEAV